MVRVAVEVTVERQSVHGRFKSAKEKNYEERRNKSDTPRVKSDEILVRRV